jgi:flagellar biosynthesis protein
MVVQRAAMAQEPEHDGRQVAIALKREGDADPRITATGRGALAEQLLQVAFATGVKVRTDADLAEILSVLDVEDTIPLEAISAVAEILAHVYRANAAMGEETP